MLIVEDRWVRFCLHLEYAMLPTGIGFAVVTPLDWYTWNRHGWPVGTILVTTAAILGIVFGLWRPVHRRLGLRRSSTWGPPPPGDRAWTNG